MHHVDIPSMGAFNKLREVRSDACVSIYLPTTPITSEIGACKIEYANQVKEALAQSASLLDKRRLADLEALLTSLSEDEEFWLKQARTLAVLATPDRIWTFRLANNLKSVVEVADRFLLSPLLRSITFAHTAHVLAISENTVRLIEIASDIEPYEVKVPNMPKDMNSATGTGNEKVGANTHARLTQYCRQIDSALRRYLTNSDIPLIVAGSEPVLNAFRAVYNGHDLIGEIANAGLDRANPTEIGDLARPVLDRYYERQIADIRARFEKLVSEGRTTTDIALAARAATFGQIDTLLADMDEMIHGTVDEETGAVSFGEEGPDTYNIIDEIAGRVLANGGKVLAVRKSDIPQQQSLAAIFRFAV
ncbi:baeRF11 domain-containing protein [Bartonella sp. LJL80]